MQRRIRKGEQVGIGAYLFMYAAYSRWNPEIRHNYEEQGKLYLDQWKEILEDVKPVIISTLHCCDSWERVPEDLKSLIDAMEVRWSWHYFCGPDSFLTSLIA